MTMGTWCQTASNGFVLAVILALVLGWTAGTRAGQTTSTRFRVEEAPHEVQVSENSTHLFLSWRGHDKCVDSLRPRPCSCT
jgi:hypothetical protein